MPAVREVWVANVKGGRKGTRTEKTTRLFAPRPLFQARTDSLPNHWSRSPWRSSGVSRRSRLTLSLPQWLNGRTIHAANGIMVPPGKGDRLSFYYTDRKGS